MPLYPPLAVLTNVPANDPLFSSVGLLVPFQTDFNDRSINARSLSSQGVIMSASAAKFGSQSAKFGSSSFLAFQGANNLGLSGDFCIEVWVHQSARPTEFSPCLECLNGTGYSFGLRNGKVNFYDGATDHTANTTIELNEWHYIAVWRKNAVLILWLDGVPDYAVSNSRNITTSGNYRVGSNSWSVIPTFWLDGYLQDLRLTLAPRLPILPTQSFPTS